jgi:integrase
MRTPIPLSTRPAVLLPADLRVELDSFLLSLEAENLAAKTRRTFVADQVARWRPNTARNRYLALKRFFDWLADEGLIDASPMARTRPPRVPEEPVPLVTDETVKAILHACEEKALADRRDAAMIRLLLDSGARRSEIAALTVDAVDLREKIATRQRVSHPPRRRRWWPLAGCLLRRHRLIRRNPSNRTGLLPCWSRTCSRRRPRCLTRSSRRSWRGSGRSRW